MKNWRINTILLFLILFGAAISCRLAYLQVLQGEVFRALAKGQYEIFEPMLGRRGEIFLSSKNSDTLLLATNKNWQFCYISPRDIKDKSLVVSKLSEVLDLDENLILKKVEKKESLFEVIKHRLTIKEIQDIKNLNLKGIYLGEELLREYPQKFSASHIVGFLGGDGGGQYGVEGYWNQELKGKEDRYYLPKAGDDIVLTVDSNIQRQAERLLSKAEQDLNIEGGQIIVIAPDSGEIIALAHLPNFDPNQYQRYAQEDNLKIFQNGAIQELFEPGSIFKPITMAIALNEGKITPQTTYIDNGAVKIGGYTIYNYGSRAYGESSMTKVLEKSINTGAVFARSQVNNDVFLDYLELFGIFKETGIGLQGEVFSRNEEFKKGYEINFATASFGQGIEMTPMQVVRAFCVIANGGQLIEPHIVKKVESHGNGTTEIQPQITPSNVISSKTASKLTAMLVSVIENGFGKQAKIPGYYIAGKTGTSQVPEKGVYSPDKSWQSFIGFAPAFNPQFLILVKLDNPETRTAEYSALPIFRDLAEYIIHYYQIPPDHE